MLKTLDETRAWAREILLAQERPFLVCVCQCGFEYGIQDINRLGYFDDLIRFHVEGCHVRDGCGIVRAWSDAFDQGRLLRLRSAAINDSSPAFQRSTFSGVSRIASVMIVADSNRGP